MPTKYTNCNTCLNSFDKIEYKISNESFCSKKCIPRCDICFKSFDERPIIGYSKIDRIYYCQYCESKKCKYCDTLCINNRCPNNCNN